MSHSLFKSVDSRQNRGGWRKIMSVSFVAFLLLIGVFTIQGWHGVPTVEAIEATSGTCWIRLPATGTWQRISDEQVFLSCAYALKERSYYSNSSGYVVGFMTYPSGYSDLNQWVVMKAYSDDGFWADADDMKWYPFNLNYSSGCNIDPDSEVGCAVQ